MILHLVRHGQTLVGDDGLYLPNAGLTELGKRQAQQAAKRINRLKPDSAFTSNLQRAIETSEFFSQLTGHVITQIPDLAELDTGNIWDAPESVKARIRNGDYTVDYPGMGGESPDEFSERVKRGFEQLLKADSSLNGDSSVGFLHEGVIQTILDLLDGFTKYDNDRRGPMPNGSFVTVDTNRGAPYFPGKWETDHLTDL